MAFERQANVVISTIADIEITLFVPQTISVETPQTGSVDVQVKMSDGSIELVSFDLLARLQDDAAGQVHLSNLADLRDYIKARLVAEVLPT